MTPEEELKAMIEQQSGGGGRQPPQTSLGGGGHPKLASMIGGLGGGGQTSQMSPDGGQPSRLPNLPRGEFFDWLIKILRWYGIGLFFITIAVAVDQILYDLPYFTPEWGSIYFSPVKLVWNYKEEAWNVVWLVISWLATRGWRTFGNYYPVLVGWLANIIAIFYPPFGALDLNTQGMFLGTGLFVSAGILIIVFAVVKGVADFVGAIFSAIGEFFKAISKVSANILTTIKSVMISLGFVALVGFVLASLFL